MNTPIMEIISRRFSCRSYAAQPIPEEKRSRLQEACASTRSGPLGARVRFSLAAATERNRDALKGLGTYGFIRGAAGFIMGTVASGEMDLEQYGYGLERLVLLATELGLGTCWLGGSFTKRSFTARISAAPGEQMPAVVAAGVMENPERARKGMIRRLAGSAGRRPWEDLFFNGGVDSPLTREKAGKYAAALDMVRLAPSASNKQPWRIVRQGDAWHFFLRRAEGYGRSMASRIIGVSDIQRVDIGIAMCHFELTAKELGLKGSWSVVDPPIEKSDALTEYRVSWIE